MFDLSVPWWEIVIRTVVVYVLVFVLLRISGKRELGQMTPFELVVILVIANAVQNAMTGGDNSLLGGIIAATTLVVSNLIVQRYARRLPFLEHLFSSEPTVLIDRGRIVDKNREREDVTVEELEMAAREKGIDDLKDVQRAVLEINGDISIIPKDDGRSPRRRRFRQFRRQ
jgi:uncharacterized membrane protein YcaP (DUF421 family)